ncbi:mucin-5AC-like [Anopheles ziemanni]|uniref:mucin-5AC-like n=1 Tax=Anopheles coustani TaxID=139045 RepID=UPI002657B45A|nr:mucin-5AC-like [Anopheles coustani]XP_058169893.1 mucin-5AC-like [Anopheles ziemanni]
MSIGKMYVFSVKWFVFGCLLVVHADENHQRQLPEFTPPPPKDHGPTTPAAIGLFIVPFPQSAADGSIVDVNPNFIAALQSGVSPFAAFVQSDTGAQRFPPDTNWTLPQHIALISTFINQTQANILKPGGQQQTNAGTSAQSSAPKDPVFMSAPLAYKPGKPNLVGQLLANAPGFNNSFAMITNLVESKPVAALASISDAPQSDPLQGLMDSPQSAVLNATSAVQGVIDQWGSNVQNGVGNFFGLSSNQPNNDQAASSSPNAPLNPVQSLVEGSQASWNNATAVAQGIAGQFGSNVQNGVSNVFGINLNRPSNDEPVTDTTQSTSPGPDTTTSTAQSSSTELAATDSSTVSTSVTGAPTSATPTSATPTSGFSNPFSSLFNTSQLSLLNNSVLVQTLTGQVSSNLANGLAGPFFANLNRPVKHDQRGASLKDNPGKGFPPSWIIPQNLDGISSLVNQSGIVKPSGGLQPVANNSGLAFTSNDPVVLNAPAYKPEKPNLVGQLLSNAPGFNNSFASISNLIQAKPESPATMVYKDTIPDPLQALISSSQSAVSNTTGAVQGTIGQWGSNVQNGVSNVFGVNVNRPSNDEPVTDTTQATSSAPDTTTSTAKTSPATDSSPTSATVAAAPAGTSIISGSLNPLVVLGGSSKPSLLNATQGLITPLGSNGLIFYKNPNRPNASQNASADTPLMDVPPTAPTCAGCTPGQCSYSPFRNLRIIGGSDVNYTTDFPWVALIKYSGTPYTQGSLINDRAILTTATIVSSMIDISSISVVLGILDRSATGTTDHMISSTYIHPGYSSSNLFADNIGILTLMTPLTSSFEPVCLPMGSQVYYPIPKATVVGWGSSTTLNGPKTDDLQVAELQMYATVACQTAYGSKVTNKNLCAGQGRPPSTKKGTCTGDGGSPLMAKPPLSSVWQLLGITIEIPNAGCGVWSQPSVFTNVAAYMDWIVTYGPGCSCPQTSPY